MRFPTETVCRMTVLLRSEKDQVRQCVVRASGVSGLRREHDPHQDVGSDRQTSERRSIPMLNEELRPGPP